VTESLTHAESILIEATPEEVYAAVSDVTRTGEWSPICRECWWDAGDGPRVGAHFTGRNTLGDRTWETRSEIVTAEAGRAFGWSVNEGMVLWTYTMAPVGAGTELTESWEFTPAGQAFFQQMYGDRAPAQIAARTQNALDGIPATLAAIKRVIEGR